MDRSPITAEGKKKLQDELTHLKTKERKKVAAEIDEARGHGDLKENSEYHAAKEKQSHMEGRIQFLENLMATCEVIDTDKLDASRVVFGVKVHLFDPDNDKELKYRIVGDAEADIAVGDVSINSPLARALIGKEVGDAAVVRAPGGDRELEILKIEV